MFMDSVAPWSGFTPVPRRPAPRPEPRKPGLKPALAEPALGALVERARLLAALDAALRNALPVGLARDCRVANVDPTRLTVLARSSTVAARLRTLQDTLLTQTAVLIGRRPDKLAVKVAPLPADSNPPGPDKPLSGAAAAFLGSAAHAVADPELKDLLRRLASLA
jgi:hypothetical protein